MSYWVKRTEKVQIFVLLVNPVCSPFMLVIELALCNQCH